MIDLQYRPSTLVDNFELLRSLLATYGPETLQKVREDALEAFARQGIPTTRDEEFKYLPLRVLSEDKFGPSYGAFIERDEVSKTSVGNLEAITVTFINGEYAPELATEYLLSKGVFVGTLKDAIEQEPELVLQYLGKIATMDGKLGTTNDERFVHLSNAFISEGAFVFVPKGTVLEQPIHLLFLSKADHGAFAAQPRVLLVLDEGAQAKVVESYMGLEGKYFTNSVTEVVLGENAILEHDKCQEESADAVHIATIAVRQMGGSTYTSTIANLGGSIVRNDVNVFLDGEHTETSLNGANVGLGSQIIDNHTRIDHAKPNCHSFEVYKSVLGDQATGVFNGKIFVYKDAQKTDAKQTNQAILLSAQATMNTKPQLEIFADDVKCTHGATIGQLRDDAMFYLRARGIPENQAKAMLIYAFAAEVIEKITIEPLKVSLEQVLFRKLGIEQSIATEEI